MPKVIAPNGNVVDVAEGSLAARLWDSAPNPSAPKSTPIPTPPSSSSSSSSRSSSSSLSSTPTVPQLPSWMGDMYKQVQGTNYYSTNPSNPNASKFYADGRPVPTIGFDHTQTGGTKFDGYGTPEQFQTIQGYLANNNQAGLANYLTGEAASGRLISNESIYGNIPKPPSATPANANSPTVPSMPQSNVPIPTNYSGARNTINNDSIKAEAQARINKLIADKTRYADQTKKGLTTTYDRLRTTVGENRALENAQMQDRLDPFNRRSDYTLGIQALQRERSDREYAQDYQTQMGNVDAQLNDFLQATPEQQQQMINELTRIEREYGLQVADRMGNLNGQRTLAGSSQDFSQMDANRKFGWGQQMDVAGMTGKYNGESTLQGKQANVNAALNVGDRRGLVLNPQDDWGNLFTNGGTPTYQSQQDAIQNQAQYGGTYQPYAREIEQMNANSRAWFDASPAEQQRLAAENQSIGARIGAVKNANGDWVMPAPIQTIAEQQRGIENTQRQQQLNQQAQQFAAQMGYDWAKLSQDQQQFVSQMALNQSKFDFDKQQAMIPKFQSAEDYAKYIDSTPGITTKDENGNVSVNKEAVERIILSSGLPEGEMAKLYQRYGLNMGN